MTLTWTRRCLSVTMFLSKSPGTDQPQLSLTEGHMSSVGLSCMLATAVFNTVSLFTCRCVSTTLGYQD